MAVALIVAAGRGERLGSGRPKALISLARKPLVQWSVDTLREVESVKEIVVALPGEALDAAPDGVVAVAGGASRSESVRNALRASHRDDPVVVHDAARPLARRELFERAIEELMARQVDAVVAAVPVSDTVKEVQEDGRTVRVTLDRARLWAVHTPQVFRREPLERALFSAPHEVLAAATDDAWLIERAGGAVAVTESGAENIKITRPLDLRLAELVLSERAP